MSYWLVPVIIGAVFLVVGIGFIIWVHKQAVQKAVDKVKTAVTKAIE